MTKQIMLHIQGSNCNGYPNCQISFNDEILFDKTVNDTTLMFDVNFKETNSLKISMFGKRFGEDGVYDTKVEDDKIIEDKHIIIEELVIDGVSIKPWWHHAALADVVLYQHQPTIGIYNNISYCFQFPNALYEWMITKNYEGYKSIGPTWKKSALNSSPDDYSISDDKFFELISTARKLIDG